MAAKAARAPSHLSRSSKVIWRKLATDYDLGREPHALLALTAALEARDRCEQARKQIAAEGLTVSTEAGSLKPHPAVNIERDSRLSMLRALRELSLDAGEVIGAANGYHDSRPPRIGTGARS